MLPVILEALLKIIFFIILIMGFVVVLIWAERRQSLAQDDLLQRR